MTTFEHRHHHFSDGKEGIGDPTGQGLLPGLAFFGNMDLCTQTLPFDRPLEETLDFVSELGITHGIVHLDPLHPAGIDPDVYLDAPEAQEQVLKLFDETDVELAAISAGGTNPLHPVNERARQADERLRQAIRLADQLGVSMVTAFSGLPGGSPEDIIPNWIVTPVPPRDQIEAHEYQWSEVAIPYWREIGELAEAHGVDIAIELHINTLVHGPTQLVRLREATHERIKGYIDPPHLTIQGIDPVESIRYLMDEEALIHFEASDVRMYESNRRLKGFNDMTSLRSSEERSWAFCSVGNGQGEQYWREIISVLDILGYDRLINIQQLHTPEPFPEGLEKAVKFLDRIVFR